MHSAVEIREADPSSYHPLVELQLERIPKLPREVAEFPFLHAEDLEFLHLRSAHVDGELVGWGAALRPPPFPPDLGIVSVTVRREHERRGYGGALFRTMVELLPDRIATVGTSVSDDDPESRAIAEAHGFVLRQHGIASELRLADLPEPLVVPGVTYEDATDLAFPDEDAVEAMLVDSQTNPEATEQGILSTLEIERSLLAGCVDPLAVLARVDGQPAAIITGEVKNGVLMIFYTGVGRAFRGRDLAFSLKQYAHLLAAGRGATVSQTMNEERNVGIRRVNERLGYRITGGEWRLSRPRDLPA